MYICDLSKDMFLWIFWQIEAQMAMLSCFFGSKPAGCDIGCYLRPYLPGEAHARWSRGGPDGLC